LVVANFFGPPCTYSELSERLVDFFSRIYNVVCVSVTIFTPSLLNKSLAGIQQLCNAFWEKSDSPPEL